MIFTYTILAFIFTIILGCICRYFLKKSALLQVQNQLSYAV